MSLPKEKHLHYVKVLRFALRHKPLTTLPDKFRADLVYSDWMQLEYLDQSRSGELISKQMHMVLSLGFVEGFCKYNGTLCAVYPG